MGMCEHFLAGLRQWTFPREFQIEALEEREWASSLVTILSRAWDEARAIKPATVPPVALVQAPVLPPFAPAGLPRAFVVELCNQCFNLQRNLVQMEAEKADPVRLKRVKRVLEYVNVLLQKHEVRWVDLTDQEYVDGRMDFQSLGQAQEVRGLDRMRVKQCECPVVYLNDKIVQVARGIVARPATQP